MSPKLVKTYPHRVENRGIAMAPLFLRLIYVKKFSQSIKIFVKLEFFTIVLTVWFVFVSLSFAEATTDCHRKEVTSWF